MLRELALVLLLLAGTSFLGPRLLTRAPAEDASHYLAFAAGAVGLAAAALCAVAHRLTQDRRLAWAGAALAVYALITVPAATCEGLLRGGQPAADAAAVVSAGADAVVALLLLLCARPAAHRTRRALLPLLGVTALAAAALAELAVLHLLPRDAAALDLEVPVLLAVWALAGSLIVSRAASAGVAPGVRLGLGVLVLGYACVLREQGEAAGPAPVAGELDFAAVRLLGLLIVLVGVVQLARRSLHLLTEQQRRERKRLRRAEAGLARIAERNHELRNGIAGLAGVTGMLDRPADEARQRVVRSAVVAELGRLDALLDDDLFEAGRCGSRGRGLGLAITRDLPAAHGGSIEFLPVVRGCTVALTLPAAQPSAQPAERPLVAAQEPADAGIAGTGGQTGGGRNAAGEPDDEPVAVSVRPTRRLSIPLPWPARQEPAPTSDRRC